MSEAVLLVGVLIAAMSLFLLVRLQSVAGLLDRVFGTRWLYAAALLRLLLGAVLIGSAATVAYPRAVALFGWLFALGALMLIVVSAPVVHRVAAWFGQLADTWLRLCLSAVLALGLFFVYAALI